MNLPPQPQVVLWLQDRQEVYICIGQLVYERGEPYAIPNASIPGHPRIKLIAAQLEQQDDKTLGLVWFLHRGRVVLS